MATSILENQGQETGEVTGTPDQDYNLVWFVQQCLSNTLRLEIYARDAERSGDDELGEFFRRAQARAKRAQNRASGSCATAW
jgi:hypothetical protein